MLSTVITGFILYHDQTNTITTWYVIASLENYTVVLYLLNT